MFLRVSYLYDDDKIVIFLIVIFRIYGAYVPTTTVYFTLYIYILSLSFCVCVFVKESKENGPLGAVCLS